MSSDSTAPAPENEAELEAFRRRWREEVQSRNTHPEDQSSRNKLPEQPSSPERSKTQHRRKSVVHSKQALAGPTSKKAQPVEEDDVAPKAYHDLPDKDHALRLGSSDAQNHERARVTQEPNSALEHYEKAVEKETHGQLGDSLKHYRKAFKLDDGVHEHYKNKHFPPSMFAKSKQSTHQHPNPSNAPPTVPNPAHHSHQDKKSHASTTATQREKPAPALPATLKQLVEDFSQLHIEATPPPTELSPQAPCPLGEIPEEILSHILLDLAITDVASFARMAQVCKRLAYLVLTEDSIWKRVTLGNEVGFAAMHYNYTTDIEGNSLLDESSDGRYLSSYDDESASDEENNQSSIPASLTHTHNLLQTTYASSWRQMFRSRPRLRFNGCYISTVNYVRQGAPSSNTLTWGAPVHVVTYFRYLRFFRDGTAVSLLTTAEPADVVHHLTKANLRSPPPSTLPGAPMKDALKARWRLSGPASSTPNNASSNDDDAQEEEEADDEVEEEEGDVHIETQGVVPRYTYKMLLGLTHAGKSARNNKLAWKGFWSYNRLTDDWGEFQLRNDRAFYWSRVKSYGGGWE
ncbi:hypothetical protein Q7P37_006882 [Cladosporium fusiforme]